MRPSGAVAGRASLWLAVRQEEQIVGRMSVRTGGQVFSPVALSYVDGRHLPAIVRIERVGPRLDPDYDLVSSVYLAADFTRINPAIEVGPVLAGSGDLMMSHIFKLSHVAAEQTRLAVLQV